MSRRPGSVWAFGAVSGLFLTALWLILPSPLANVADRVNIRLEDQESVVIPHIECPSPAPTQQRPPSRRKQYTPRSTATYSFHHCLLQPHSWQYRRCRFGNICIHKSSFYYFVEPDASYRQATSVNFQGYQTPIADEPAWLALDTRGNGFAPNKVNAPIEQFAKDNGARITWHREPMYYFLKHACGNAGHCMMENMLPLVADMQTWAKRKCGKSPCNLFDNLVVMHEHDNGNDCGCGGYRMACGSGASETPAMCNMFVNNTVGLMSNNPPMYVNRLPSGDGASMDCFLEAYAGHGGMNPYVADPGRDFTMMAHSSSNLRALRDITYERIGVPQPSLMERLTRLETGVINLVAHKKVGRRMIANFDEVITWMTNYQLEIDGKLYTIKPNVIRWEDHHFVDTQLQVLAQTDVYLTAAGSASFQSWLLPDETAMITTTFCDPQNGHVETSYCNPFEFKVGHTASPIFQSFYYWVDSMDELVTSSAPDSYDTKMVKDKAIHLLRQAAVTVVRSTYAAAAVWEDA